MTTEGEQRRREGEVGCVVGAVVFLLFLFFFYVIVDSHYEQIDTSEIKNLKVRIEALEQKVKQP